MKVSFGSIKAKKFHFKYCDSGPLQIVHSYFSGSDWIGKIKFSATLTIFPTFVVTATHKHSEILKYLD